MTTLASLWSPDAAWRARARQALQQARALDWRDPAGWPPLPRLGLLLCLVLGILAACRLFLLADAAQDLEAERRQEQALRAEFTRKASQAQQLEALRRQRAQVQAQLQELERQLPGKAEIDALLSDINQAGLARGLHFELFRPGQVQLRSYYAELPIALKVSGSYHSLARFAADIAAMPRIVTLQQIQLTQPATSGSGAGPGGSGAGAASAVAAAAGASRETPLVLEATLRTFRALEPEEVQAASKPRAPGGRP